jgi:hypothetical protein
MLTFSISLIVACTCPRAKLRSAALLTAIVFGLVNALFAILSAYGSFDLRVLAQAGQSEVLLVALSAAVISLAEVVAAFLLVWGLRRFFSSRKKGNK